MRPNDGAIEVLGKPEDINFLGLLTSAADPERRLSASSGRPRRDRMRARLRAIKERTAAPKLNLFHYRVSWLRQSRRGYFAYHAVPTTANHEYIPDTMLRTSGAGRSSAGVKGPIYMGTD